MIDNALSAGNPIPEEFSARAKTRCKALADGTANREVAKQFPAAFQFTNEMGWIPEGWEERKIEDVIQRLPVGKKYSQKTASHSGNIPILDQGKSGIIGYHNDKAGVHASTDDPVIVFANHTCYMRLIMYNFSVIQNVLPYCGRSISIYWIYCATFGKQKFIEYKGHWPDFVIKNIAVPDEVLTSKFGKAVETSFQKINANEKEIQYLSNLRDTLLPKLISGEIRIPEAEKLTEEALA